MEKMYGEICLLMIPRNDLVLPRLKSLIIASSIGASTKYIYTHYLCCAKLVFHPHSSARFQPGDSANFSEQQIDSRSDELSSQL